MSYKGPERRIGDDVLVSLAEVRKDISHISDKMEDHDFQSQQFRTALINRVETIEYSVNGNGKKGLMETVGDLEKASTRGKTAWKMLISMCSVIASGVAIYFIKDRMEW